MAARIDLCRCPKSRSPLVASEDQLVCSDADCRLSFPIRDGIPVMMIDQATELSSDAWQKVVPPELRSNPPTS